MCVRRRINDTAKQDHSANNGVREMAFVSFDGADDSEYSGYSFTDIRKLLGMQDTFCFEK